MRLPRLAAGAAQLSRGVASGRCRPTRCGSLADDAWRRLYRTRSHRYPAAAQELLALQRRPDTPITLRDRSPDADRRLLRRSRGKADGDLRPVRHGTSRPSVVRADGIPRSDVPAHDNLGDPNRIAANRRTHCRDPGRADTHGGHGSAMPVFTTPCSLMRTYRSLRTSAASLISPCRCSGGGTSSASMSAMHCWTTGPAPPRRAPDRDGAWQPARQPRYRPAPALPRRSVLRAAGARVMGATI